MSGRQRKRNLVDKRKYGSLERERGKRKLSAAIVLYEGVHDYQISWKKTLYVIGIALSAGIGGLTYGYYSGLICAYVEEEFKHKSGPRFRPEILVMILVSFGGFLPGGGAEIEACNNCLGRRGTIRLANFLFIMAGLFMANRIPDNGPMNLLGIGCLGWGAAMAFPSSTIYISEIAPASMRGALVSTLFLQIPLGQILIYCLISLSSNKKVTLWHWMLGIIPALIQVLVMGRFPDSPRWLYRKGFKKEAVDILMKIHASPHEVAKVVEEIELSMKIEIAEEGCIEEEDYDKIVNRGGFGRMRDVWGKVVPCRRLICGIGCQVAQQFVGINIVIHYSYTIFNLAGYNTSKNEIFLVLTIIISALSAVGTVFCIALVDRIGRRRLLLISIYGIITCLGVLSYVFYFGAANNSKFITKNNMSPEIIDYKYRNVSCHHAKDFMWYTTEEGLSRFGVLALVALALYIIFHSLGLGTVPWIINSEIYPMKYRTVCGVISSVAYWFSKLLMYYFFNLAVYMSNPCVADVLFCLLLFSSVVGLFIHFYVPETKGFPLEEVEKRLQLQKMTKMRDRKNKVRSLDQKLISSRFHP